MAVLAVDVGGTTIKAAVVDDRGVVRRGRFPTRRADGPEAVIDAIVEAAQTIATDAAVSAAGVVVPGLVDEDGGVGVYSVNIGWSDMPVRRLLEERLGLDIAFGHDVRAAALAEAELGAAAGEASALFVAIGTGIAAALVVDGVVVRGAHGQAGELGQVPVRHPETGQLVRLEEIASAHAMGARSGGRDASEVVAAAAAGDERARRIWLDAVEQLAFVLGDAVSMVDPACLVVGGGLSRAGAALIDPLRAGLGARLVWRETPPVVLAKLRDDAGWVGAALLAQRMAGEKSEWAGLDVT